MNRKDITLIPVENKTLPMRILINSGEFDGVVFSYGKVSFDDEDQGVMSFNYEVFENKPDASSTSAFEKFLGDLLVDILREQLGMGEVQYAGGIDE